MRLALALLVTLAGCRCSQEDFQPDDAQRICLTLQACSPREFQTTFGGSLEFCTTNPSPGLPTPGTLEPHLAVTSAMDQPMRALYRCLLDARGDCAKADRCWALDGDAGTCNFPSGFQNASCDRSVMTGCTLDNALLRVDCARHDAGCTWLGAFAGCALTTCQRRAMRCVGDERELCIGNGVFMADCARDGQRCEELRDGGTRCVSDVACARKDLGRCEGSVAINCLNEFESRTDCALNPTRKRCDKGVCVETGTQCSGLRASCQGTQVQYCHDGFTRQVDCVSAGFAGCDAGACVPHESRL